MDKSSLTISDVIKIDDNEINKLYKNYLISKGNIDDQQHWSDQFQQKLIRHITAEELILYPAFEKYIEQGNKISDQNLNDHQNMKKLLFFLETISISDPQYELRFNQLIRIFNEHIQREQNIDLPKLENVITSELNLSLTQSFQQTKNSKHFKPYPSSSINPPL